MAGPHRHKPDASGHDYCWGCGSYGPLTYLGSFCTIECARRHK